MGLTSPTNPEVGLRVQFAGDAGSHSLTVDFVCDAAMPRAHGNWVALAARQRAAGDSGGSYFVSVRSAFGCPIRVSAKAAGAQAGAPRAANSDVIEWVSQGAQKVGWRYKLGPLYDKVFELEAPHGHGFVELSLAANLPCGSARQRGIAGCLHMNGVAPEVAGMTTDFTIWRASNAGVHLKFASGAPCGGRSLRHPPPVLPPRACVAPPLERWQQHQ